MTQVQLASVATREPGAGFLDEVMGRVGASSRLDMCIQCGTCGGSCPSADDMDHTPRALFAMIRAGMRDAVLSSNTPWMCVSCYRCAVRCPQDIPITDVMYALKAMAVECGTCRRATAPDFSRAFIWNIETFGRSFEVGLTARHYLRHYLTRLPAMAPMGISMLRSGRMTLLPPRRIHGIPGLRRILVAAKELEAAKAGATRRHVDADRARVTATTAAIATAAGGGHGETGL